MKVLLLASTLLAACTYANPVPVLQIRATGFDFNKQKVRGVNAGGWLVLEPWITPSLWNQWRSNPAAGPVDEYHLCKVWGKTACLSRLTQHWNTWFTEADFQRMAAMGLNTVRIPIGYWAFKLNKGDPYVQGQVAYLDRAIGWARKYGLKVWIDIHGAPGSQNGFDNSGLRDQILWQGGSTIQATLNVITMVANKYAQPQYQDTVVIIELLNEPLGPRLNLDKLRQFYLDGFGRVRSVSGTWIAISDAFEPVSSWNGILGSSGNNVIVDHHHYQVFSQGEVSRNFGQQIAGACAARGEIEGSNKKVVVGEWSGAMTDCARWLNGWNRGARYDGTYQSSVRYGSCANKGELAKMTWDEKQNLRKYLEAQKTSWETGAGWIFWTWKAEPGNNNDDWNLSKLFDWGLFAAVGYKYPKVCG